VDVAAAVSDGPSQVTASAIAGGNAASDGEVTSNAAVGGRDAGMALPGSHRKVAEERRGLLALTAPLLTTIGILIAAFGIDLDVPRSGGGKAVSTGAGACASESGKSHYDEMPAGEALRCGDALLGPLGSTSLEVTADHQVTVFNVEHEAMSTLWTGVASLELSPDCELRGLAGDGKVVFDADID
jgi:hypothetical protein